MIFGSALFIFRYFWVYLDMDTATSDFKQPRVRKNIRAIFSTFFPSSAAGGVNREIQKIEFCGPAT